MQSIHIIALTHRTTDVKEIGRYHLSDERRGDVLRRVKSECRLDELMYLSTCNRVEFLLVTDAVVDKEFVSRFFRSFSSDPETVAHAMNGHEVFSNENALNHIFSVASSLDSLVVGEREIITQVRGAYEESRGLGITGDTLRLLVKKTIETAKTVYTHTDIARNPVSVVSLAYRKLRALNVPLNARFIFVGAGITNTAMARYLKKHGYSDFAVFNRTLANAELLAAELGGTAFPLYTLDQYRAGFDVIVTCTGAEETIITPVIYRALTNGDQSRKVVIDLAVPNDLDPEVLEQWDVNLIAVNNLQDVAKENLKEREGQLEACNRIIADRITEFRNEHRQRQVELAMSAVPQKVKEIRETVNDVFAKEIGQMDDASKAALEKILGYVEKKYISVPMKMAREILEEEFRQN